MSIHNESSKTTKSTNNSTMTNKEIREEYFKQLRSWLTTVNNYQCYYNLFQQELLKNNYQPNSVNPTGDSRDIPTVIPETEIETETETTAESTQFVGIRCQIPSLWKRFGAECIDFILLSIIKFFVAYFVVDSVTDFDFFKYNTMFMQDDFNVDYSTAVEVTSELLFLEITHRMIVCVYEIYWLQGGTLFHGGATVGKILLDLTVVRCDKLFHIRGQADEIIAVSPGGDLGWKRATFRSITKNLFFAFLFPLPFITAAANENRCAYDVLCGSMVVEVVQPLSCEISELIPIT